LVDDAGEQAVVELARLLTTFGVRLTRKLISGGQRTRIRHWMQAAV